MINARWQRVATFLLALAAFPSAAALAGEFQVTPGNVILNGNFARAQLVVAAADEKGLVSERSADLTAAVTYQSARPEIAAVNKTGQVLAVANGETTITVTAAGKSKSVPVKVSSVSDHPAIGFT